MPRKNRDSFETSNASPPRRNKQSARASDVSVIGPTLVFKGELSADEDLVIEGTVEGTIAHHRKNLTISKTGKVAADIHASSVNVEGELVGDIHSDGLVTFAKGASVNGNVYCARFVVEDGAKFHGTIDMSYPARETNMPGSGAVEEGMAG